MTRWLWLLPLLLVVAGLVWLRSPKEAGQAGGDSESANAPPSTLGIGATSASVRMRVVVVARYSHDTDAFTQGLLWHEGRLYETTGHYGRSRLRRWDLETGVIEQETRLERNLFGEGLAVVGSAGSSDSGDSAGSPDSAAPATPATPATDTELIWLTWKAGRALRFDLEDFSRLGEFSFEGEGWGLALCDGELYRSDGTSTLWRHDPETFALRGRFEVSRGGVPIEFLNELECTPNGILANVWTRDEIVRIDPRSGRVTATIDASGLLTASERVPEGVLNGIAYRSETDTLLITGKYWPWLFEVVLEAASE